ncbi:MAG: isoprenylcysteine carboxylmethyltransferase family protein [Clostridia bacterium]|nr:isoprenylcysteine carboxylmethyltransferase family protein [Clostridia bacterium]
MKPLANAAIKFTVGVLLVGVLLFLPAGGLDYKNGWLFLVLLFLPMLLLGIVLAVKNPALLQKRLDAKEKQTAQKGVVSAAALLFIGGFVLAGLDHRFGWSQVPPWAVAVASVVLLFSYALYAEVMRENTYLSRTIEVQEGQTVVDTGMYGIVRHPMYAVTVWLFLSIPVVLGSWWAVLCFLPYAPVIVIRLLNEEKLLEAELEGYAAYKNKVKYRLLPYIW